MSIVGRAGQAWPSEPTGGYAMSEMAQGRTVAYSEHATVEEAIAAGCQVIAAATRLPVHSKTLVVVSDDRKRIMWAAASDGWEADYRPGSAPELR